MQVHVLAAHGFQPLGHDGPERTLRCAMVEDGRRFRGVAHCGHVDCVAMCGAHHAVDLFETRLVRVRHDAREGILAASARFEHLGKRREAGIIQLQAVLPWLMAQRMRNPLARAYVLFGKHGVLLSYTLVPSPGAKKTSSDGAS